MPTEEQQNGAGLKYLRETFSVDLRSLAVLRISIALIIFYNLMLIGSSAPMFYQESGVLPGELNREVVHQSGGGFWSVLWLSESANWFWLCLGVLGLAATSLTLGFFTTVSTAVCLVLVWSFQVRNPLVLTAGDILLRMVLVWGLFLPWGRIWSVDYVRSRDKRGTPTMQLSSFATAAIMLQLAFIYFFSGIAKLSGDWSGTALVQSLNLEMYVKGNWSWLLEQASLLNIMAMGILVVEIAGPILLFVPRFNQFWRGMMMALMCLMHLLIWISMSIGIFSIIAMVTWLVFIPGEVWNRLLGRPNPMKRKRTRRRSSRRSSWKQGKQYVCAGLLLFVALLNLDKTKLGQFLPRQLNSLATTLMIQQEFKMFASPPTSSPWPQYVSTLKDGQVVELFRDNGGFVDEKPQSVYRYMKSQFWRRYHFNLIDAQPADGETPPIYHQLRKRLLDVQVEKWNRRHEKSEQVATAELLMNFDLFGSDGQPTGDSTQQCWARTTAE